MADARQAESVSSSNMNWRQALDKRIPLFGHRNWIVVADSAYPAQSCEGIETIASNADHIEVLEEILRGIARSKHLRPIIHTDQELEFLEEADAPGISAFRRQLSGLLKEYAVDVRPHDEIISALDQTGQVFRVLIIKTSMTLPYTSVFVELDCGYWSAEAETRLRTAIARHLVRQGGRERAGGRQK